MPSHFIWILVGLYFLSSLAFGIYLKRFSLVSLRLGRGLLGLAVAFHWGTFLGWVFKDSRSFVPLSSVQSQMSVLALMGLGCWALSIRKSAAVIVMFILPAIAMALALLHFSSDFQAEARSLPSPWLWIHILLMLLGEAFFAFAAFLSLVYLLTEWTLKRRRLDSIFARVPSLPDFDRLLGECLLAGFTFLTLGMLMGFFFAKGYWADGWFWDPKVIFCFLSWILYGVVLVFRKLNRNYRGRKTAFWASIGFISIIFLSWGMDLILPSRHHTNFPASEVGEP